MNNHRSVPYAPHVRFAIDIPNFGTFDDPHLAAVLAREAEAAGRDAVSVPDDVMRDPNHPHADPWILPRSGPPHVDDAR